MRNSNSTFKAAILACLLLSSTFVVAAPRKGVDPESIYISATANYMLPTPSYGGVDVDFNFGHLLRLSAGTGVYGKTVGQTGGQIWMYSLLSTVIWALSLGHADWRSVYHHASGADKDNIKAVLTWGLRAQAFVPVWKFSPAVGVGVADWYASPPESLSLNADQGTHTFYTFGFDYADDWGHVGAGATYAPKMPSNRRTAPYISAGARLW